jgi:flagellar hook assembly protein FlgD
VTAQLVGPDGVPHVLEAAARRDPGSYTFPVSAFDAEGTWRWQVSATDDLERVSSIERTFRYDTTLQSVTAPRLATGSASVSLTLARAAKVLLRIETRGGVVVATVPARSLAAGSSSIVWNGLLGTHTRAPSGGYVAHVFATSDVGTSDLSASFSFRRVAA